jgi:hypothetical protein
MHLWGCSSPSIGAKSLLLVLASNRFVIINRTPDSKWRDMKQKSFDFSQINGDFISLLEMT